MKRANNSDRRARQTAAQVHALAAVRRDIGSRDSAAARKYLREFAQVFQNYDAVLTPQELAARMAVADILLVGDYHALPASQRFAASSLEQFAQVRPVALGLEAVLSRDQRIVDAWWRREIQEDELRQRLRFDREWGYEWSPFYELLIAAREYGEGIYGLDCMPRDDLRKISSRDRHAASKIGEVRERHPGAVVLVLFGESHLAPQHLPRALHGMQPDERVLTVLQNVDAIYWKAIQENAPAVSIDEDTICVFNSSPLEKYESYRLCIEKWNTAADDLPDFTPAVHNLIISLARCLGFRLDSPRNGTQPKFLADSLPEVVCVKTDCNGTGDSSAQPEEDGCAYVPETNTFFVREFEMSNAAREAARFLHHACRGTGTGYAHTKPVEDALAHLGSRLLLPAIGIENQPLAGGLGESLYHAYLAGRVTKPALRRMFLARLEDRHQAEKVLAGMLDASRGPDLPA